MRLIAADRPVSLRIVVVSVAAGLLFLLPFVLWTVNALPEYVLAAVFAVLLAMAALAVGVSWTGERLAGRES